MLNFRTICLMSLFFTSIFSSERAKPVLPERKSTVETKKTEEVKTVATKKADKDVFIYNSYTRKRGTPKMINIYCAKCSAHIMSYQKDGPGRLLRCYLDRIHEPEDLKKRQNEDFNVKSSPKLECSECGNTIGIPIIYKAEMRPAYRMFERNFYINN